MEPKTLLDTDILSAILKRQPNALMRGQRYLSDHPRFSFSLMSRFEILRGLKARNATTQIFDFESFCAVSEVLPLNEDVVIRASDTYAALYQSGKLIQDADLLIAATALAHGIVLASNNLSHFNRILGLSVDNWLA